MNGQSNYEGRYRTMLERNDLLAMQALAPLSSTYLPWSASAMRPSGVAVLNEIFVNRRRCVVELGSGVSTFFIARLLRQRGGHIWTVEHDERWADLVGEELASEGLGDVVTVVHAPLTPIQSEWPDEEASWYDQSCLKEMTAGAPVDLLIVDGPPAYEAGREHARYPRGPLLRLNARRGLRRCPRRHRPARRARHHGARWEHDLALTFERRPANGRIGIGRPGAAFIV